MLQYGQENGKTLRQCQINKLINNYNGTYATNKPEVQTNGHLTVIFKPRCKLHGSCIFSAAYGRESLQTENPL